MGHLLSPFLELLVRQHRLLARQAALRDVEARIERSLALRAEEGRLGEVLAYPLIGTVFSRSVGAHLTSGSNAGRIDEASGKFFPAITITSLSAAREIALACDAVLPISPACVEGDLGSEDLVIVDFTAPWMQVQYGFVSKKDRTHSPAMLRFMEKVREVEQAAIEREAALIAAYANFGNLRKARSGTRRASSR